MGCGGLWRGRGNTIVNPHNVRFTPHAMLKFDQIRSHGIQIDEATVINTVLFPQQVTTGYRNRLIAQSPLDARKVLRVVYEESDGGIVIVTFYPGRRARYEWNGVQQRG